MTCHPLKAYIEIAYVSPENLELVVNPELGERLLGIVVDESHCVVLVTNDQIIIKALDYDDSFSN